MKLAVFELNATPPTGTPLAYDRSQGVTNPLLARGVVLSGAFEPIVLMAVDWLGIANETHLAFRAALAEAAGTAPSRVCVHTVHQHDAPYADAEVHRLLVREDFNSQFVNSDVEHMLLAEAPRAVENALATARTVTHIGYGQAEVEQIASNRRILDSEGRVRATRWSACKDEHLRAAPTGVVDPQLKLVSFWHEQQPLAALTYFAAHPQSYYRTAKADADYPGLARAARDQATGAPHIHFVGAAGNVAAGKWNDATDRARSHLTERLIRGMRNAWAEMRHTPVTDADVDWRVEPIVLPLPDHLRDDQAVESRLRDSGQSANERIQSAVHLSWLRRWKAHKTVDLARLRIGPVDVLHMPGELFVEYQLAAQQMRPDRFVALAAYGDSGPGYLGTAKAYTQGGYETTPSATATDSTAESVLMTAIQRLLI